MINKTRKNLSGWGRNKFVDVSILEPKENLEIKKEIQLSAQKKLIARGLGRAYGDSSLLERETLISLRNFRKVKLDKENNELTAEGGASFDEILEIIIPMGYFCQFPQEQDLLLLEVQ